MHAFILAGGFATRLWPLTESRPKPLLPLAGKPILTHLVEKIPGNIPITVSTNAVFADAFHAWQSQIINRKSPIVVLIEDTRHDDQKLGALGAVAQWITDTNIDDDILLLTGDNYLGCSLESFLESARPDTPLLAAHDIGDLEHAKQFGTVVIDQSQILPTGQAGANQKIANRPVHSFEEKPKDPKSTLVSTGCSLLPRSSLPILVEYAKEHPDNVGGIFEEFLRRKIPVEAFLFYEPWFDIGSFDAYLEATTALVGRNVLVGEQSLLGQSECTGSVVLGNNCTVRNATLENVVLFDGCTIENCDLRDCICDNDCMLKGIDLQKKMLRRGTTLLRED
jgi:glucose-1-phosphate thymidylyltransferase